MTDADLDRLVERLAPLVARRLRPAVDDDALALLEALAVHLDGGDFSSDDFAELITHDARFKALAWDADVSPESAPYWLRKMAGAFVGPLELVRVGKRRPVVWRFS
jgi:hypothetical protein